MTEAILLFVGLLIGGAAGVWIGLLRGRGALAAEAAGLRAAIEEVRTQLAARDAEIADVRRALEAEKETATTARTRLEAAREHFAEQRRQIEEMEKKVKDTFGALSATALKSNNEQFLKAAEQNMKPLREQLERYEKYIKELEKSRAEAYGGLNKHLRQLETGREQLSRDTQSLVAALRQPGAKGRWGEISLRNLLELSGMSAYCDFDEQVSITTTAGRLRPDAVVHLPGDRSLVIDSKVNTSAYLDAVQATDDAARKRHLVKYVGDLRTTARTLGGKEYWRQFDDTPEFVVMFMAGEAFFAAAVAEEPKLIQECLEWKVLLASPTTLAALLMAIKHGWQQQQMAENAEKIARAGRELHDRLCTFVSHLDDVRAGIKKAAEAFNRSVGNWESRTLPGVKRLVDLGAGSGEEMKPLERIDVTMRTFQPEHEDEAADPAQPS